MNTTLDGHVPFIAATSHLVYNGIYRLILFSILTIGPPVIGLSLEHLGVLPTVSIVWSGLLLQVGFLFVNRQMRLATLPHAEA